MGIFQSNLVLSIYFMYDSVFEYDHRGHLLILFAPVGTTRGPPCKLWNNREPSAFVGLDMK